MVMDENTGCVLFRKFPSFTLALSALFIGLGYGDPGEINQQWIFQMGGKRTVLRFVSTFVALNRGREADNRKSYSR